ncbi:MAG: hypothetical protein QOE06_822 [Thermoleophilaceae bacterium]|nr:hypothetical protein [Thermoleophilaceae bacterium]
MSGSAITRAVAITAVLALVAGCGSDKKGTSKPAAGTKAPPQLVGAYSTTLQTKDLPPNPPPELTDGSRTWTLKIANSGGPGNGPALTIVNDKLGSLESSHLEVAGGLLRIQGEECAVKGAPVESEYVWFTKGKQLALKVAKNGCPDKIAATILTAHPWTKKG